MSESPKTEGRPRPDVAAVLRALREQVQDVNVIQVGDVSLVKQIRDKVADILEMDKVRPSVQPVVETLSREAAHISSQVRLTDVGTVLRIGDGVAKLSGLPSGRTEELVTFPTGVRGMVLNLEQGSIDVILLGSDLGIQGGDLVTGSGERLQVPVGRKLLGRVVTPLGEPLDERGPLEATDYSYLERQAPLIVERVPVHEPLQTGLKVIDSMLAIGRGQRELIIGDRQTGKTTIAVDTIINQRDSGVICVYVAVGQKKSSVLAVIETLRAYGAMPYTTVVMSGPDDPPALRYLAPYTGAAIAESMMYEGSDVLIVYDDLTKHANAYRELSLLLRRPPGREAYPGDIFYLHARLLERAAKLTPDLGGGSMTALPIVETQRGNISAYIPTNLISITDGQIVLDTEIFNRNVRPAVDVGRSVSRVGGAAQTEAMRQVAGKLKLDLAQYQEVARFARFGTEVDEATQRQIQRGMRLEAALRQPIHQPLELADMILVLNAATGGYLDDVEPEEVPTFARYIRERFRTEYEEPFEAINRTGRLTEDRRDALAEALTEYRADWAQRNQST